MPNDLTDYRSSEREKLRVADLFSLMPKRGVRALDIGARDGFLSRLLAERFESVVALDLERPKFDYPGVQTVAGNATHLDFPDASFDLVLCAEVLEHIPYEVLPKACSEIARVTGGVAVIGVPFRQDLRSGETTCYTCGKPNPPWGHVNSFTEQRLRDLFSGVQLRRTSFVGSETSCTNAISARLLRFAGNPFGTYMQDEPCIHCGNHLQPPPTRTLPQKVATRVAFILNSIQGRAQRPRPIWIHAQFVANGES